MTVDNKYLDKIAIYMMISGYDHYENEPIGSDNPYYCCSSCGISDPQINGYLFNHDISCSHLNAELETLMIPSSLINPIYDYFSDINDFSVNEKYRNTTIRYLLEQLGIADKYKVKKVKAVAQEVTYEDIVLASAYLYFKEHKPKDNHNQRLLRCTEWKNKYISDYLINDLNNYKKHSKKTLKP